MTILVGSLAVGGLVPLLLVIAIVPRLAARAACGRLRQTSRLPANRDEHPLPSDVRWAEFLEQWSRDCLAGSSLHAGFLRSVERFPDLAPCLAETCHGLRRGGSLVDPTDPRLPPHWRSVLHLVGRTLRITPLAREAQRLRHAEAQRTEVAAQLATLRASIGVLVWAPLYVSGFIVLFVSAARELMFGSRVGLALIVVGVALQQVGRWWISRLLTPATAPDDADFLEGIASALEAGFTVHQSLTLALHLSSSTHAPAGTDEMLDDVRLRFPELSPMVDLLASDHGLPLAARLYEFATALRVRRIEESRAHIRRMSVKANVPLVICVLPSFLLLSFFPLVAMIVAPLSSVHP